MSCHYLTNKLGQFLIPTEKKNPIFLDRLYNCNELLQGVYYVLYKLEKFKMSDIINALLLFALQSFNVSNFH